MSRRVRSALMVIAAPLLLAWGWSALTLVTRRAEGSAEGGGTLKVTPAKLAFDHVASGRPEPARLTFHNVGQEAVRITGAKSTCGCTVPELPKQVLISPGESFVLAVNGSPPGIGEKHVMVTIHTDSPTQPTIRVPVILNGKPLEVPFVTSLPDRLALRTTRPGPMTREFAVHTTEAKDAAAWLGDVTAGDDECKAEPLGMTEQPGPAGAVLRHYRFRVTLSEPPRDGTPVVCRLRLATTRPAQVEPKPIEVTCRFVPAVRAVPDELYFRLDGSETGPVERTVRFQAEEENDPITIAPEGDWPDWLESGEIEPQPAGSSLVGRATVRVHRDRVPPDGETELVFNTDHPDSPTVRVKVRVVGGGPS